MGDSVAGLEALQVLGQAVVLSLQFHQLGLPANPAALQLAPLLPLALNLPCQVVHHRLKRACHGHMLCPILLQLLAGGPAAAYAAGARGYSVTGACSDCTALLPRASRVHSRCFTTVATIVRSQFVLH